MIKLTSFFNVVPLIVTHLQGKYLGSNKHMYESLVTGPLGTSECAGECPFLQTRANVL